MQQENSIASAVVYIVEDDQDYRCALKIVVSSAGYDVAAYADSVGLLSEYDPHRPGCCILDLQTPGADAVDICRALNERGGSHPFIVISAHGTIPSVSQAMRNGAVDFLAKPVEHSLLLQRIAEAIASDARARAVRSQRDEVKQRMSTLTRREYQVLGRAVQGLASKQIAKQLEIGVSTVDVHRSNLMKKMKIDSIIQLASVLSAHDLELTNPEP